MRARQFVLLAVVAGLASVTTVAGVASAHDSHPSPHPSTHPSTHPEPAPAAAAVRPDSSGPATYLAGALRGRNEIPTPGGPAVGDQDGRATAVVKVKGNQVTFAVRWDDTATPTALHIHSGAKGTNGDIKIGLFGKALPAGARAVSGTVTVADTAVLQQLRSNPGDFYVNLHTGEFPGGAVRSQLHKLNKPVELGGVLNGAATATLDAHADGRQEVPGPKPSGDRDGRAEWLLTATGTSVSYAATWSGIAPVTNGHLHEGDRGTNGPVVADLFADTEGLPAGVNGIAGTTQVDAALASRIAARPKHFYTNLHSTEFSGGAVRGQLSEATNRQPHAVNADVLGGSQIYHCTATGFAQFGVAAVLRGDILHSFVQPVAGPPQWQAPDGTAVTGKVVTKTPNGDGNIPELVLDATRTGKRAGMFGATTQVLRLNTIGGVAPAGACTPGSVATVPYQADYLFLG